MLTSILRSNQTTLCRMAVRAFAGSSPQMETIMKLCKANSGVIADEITVIDHLVDRKHANGANEVFTRTCPIVNSTMGKQYRHSLDHLEKVALDGLRTVRDNDEPVDLHYDRRERGKICERDIFEARGGHQFMRLFISLVLVGSQAEE